MGMQKRSSAGLFVAQHPQGVWERKKGLTQTPATVSASRREQLEWEKVACTNARIAGVLADFQKGNDATSRLCGVWDANWGL